MIVSEEKKVQASSDSSILLSFARNVRCLLIDLITLKYVMAWSIHATCVIGIHLSYRGLRILAPFLDASMNLYKRVCPSVRLSRVFLDEPFF